MKPMPSGSALLAPMAPAQQANLGELITLSLTNQRSMTGSALVDEITEQFSRLDRRELSQLGNGLELVELKYAMSDWRLRTAKHLLAGLAGLNRGDFAAVLRDLAKLSLVLDSDQTAKLIESGRGISSAPEWMAYLGDSLRQFGDEGLAHAFLKQEKLLDQLLLFGFDHRLGKRIKAYYPIRGKLRAWITHDSAAHYNVTDDGTINYRGLRLRAGDLVVADLNMNHEGLYTSFVSPRSYATHSAMVLLLEEQDKHVPALLEIHKKGARIVPLSRFCGGDFCNYLEVYRIGTLERHTSARRLAAIVRDMLANEQLVYDFRGRPAPSDGVLPDGEPFVTCTTLLELVLRRAGVAVEFATSTVNAGARANLELMGLEVPEQAFLPTDIVRTEGLTFVGALDNNRLRQNLVREAVMGFEDVSGSLAHAFATRTLQTEALPIRHHLEEIIIHSAQSSNLVARLGGFDNSEQIPRSAPVGMLALLMMANTMVATGVKELNQSPTFDFLTQAREPQAFSLTEFESMPAVRWEIQRSFDRNKVSRILPGPVD